MIPSPGLPHVDADLERYVPERIGTTALVRLSVSATTFTPGGDMCIVLCGNEPGEFAKALGIPVERVTVAVAMSDAGGIGAVAFRAPGAPTDGLAAAGLAIRSGVIGGEGPSFPLQVGARDVTFLYRLNRSQYLVPIGDVLVFLYGEGPATDSGRIDPTGTVPPEVVALIEELPR